MTVDERCDLIGAELAPNSNIQNQSRSIDVLLFLFFSFFFFFVLLVLLFRLPIIDCSNASSLESHQLVPSPASLAPLFIDQLSQKKPISLPSSSFKPPIVADLTTFSLNFNWIVTEFDFNWIKTEFW